MVNTAQVTIDTGNDKPAHPHSLVSLHCFTAWKGENIQDFLLEHWHMGLDATKPVFGDFDNVILKPVSSATETS